eukprot:6993116-Prymnesium_polylepis.1
MACRWLETGYAGPPLSVPVASLRPSPAPQGTATEPELSQRPTSHCPEFNVCRVRTARVARSRAHGACRGMWLVGWSLGPSMRTRRAHRGNTKPHVQVRSKGSA